MDWIQSVLAQSLLAVPSQVSAIGSVFHGMRIVSSLALAVSTIALFLAIMRSAHNQKDRTSRSLLWLAAMFFLASGIAHALGLLSIWIPLSGVISSAWSVAAVTAVVAAIAAWRLLPRALFLPSRLEVQHLSEQLAHESAERERAEQQLRQHQQELENEVASRTADLEQAKQALQREIAGRAEHERERLELERQIQHSQKLESLGLLAGGIAHDFNNLLMGILGNADVVLRQWPPAAPGKERIEQIKGATLVAADLTRQILAYAGKGRFQTKHVSLNTLVENLTQLLQATVPKKTALRFHLVPDLPEVLADDAQIHQVAMNLITNAAEAIGERVGTISIRTGVEELTAEFLATCFPREPRPAGPYVFLEVADTGSGMDDATRERIFEPFFTTKFTGRGLGLAAVLGIMRGHKGAVHVHSLPGAGTRLRVFLPPAAVPEEAPAVTPPPTRYHGRGATILVIDDEPMVRSTLSAMLKSLGFTVLTAADGLEGVDLFRANKSRIAAVLLDMTMPRMNGEETFRELRRAQPNVRVILCSGYSEQEAADRFAGRGVAGFLQKPFGLDGVSSRLTEVLDGGTAWREASG